LSVEDAFVIYDQVHLAGEPAASPNLERQKRVLPICHFTSRQILDVLLRPQTPAFVPATASFVTTLNLAATFPKYGGGGVNGVSPKLHSWTSLPLTQKSYGICFRKSES